MADPLQQVLAALAPHRRPNPFGSDLFRSRWQVWHVPAATQRRLARDGYPFGQAPAAQRRHAWRTVWEAADVLEARLQCLWPLLLQPREHRLQHWDDIRWYCARLENWCEADYLASMVAECLEQSPQRVLPVLARWNRDADPWRRRQSLTGLFYYQRLRRQPPPLPVVLAHLETQLAAPEHYVQKAVGWTLREAWQVYPAALAPWLEARLPCIGSGAWATLCEKLPAATARRWQAIRRRERPRQRRP